MSAPQPAPDPKLTRAIWIAECINNAIPTGNGWTDRELAEQLAEQLIKKDPQRYRRWLLDIGPEFLTQLINSRQRAQSRSIQQKRRSVFANLAATQENAAKDETVEAPDWDAFFTEPLHVVEHFERKCARDLTTDDLTFLIRRESTSAKARALNARFHEAVRAQVIKAKAKKVGDVMDAETYWRLSESIIRTEETK
jgi:hypothetical protein